MGLQSVRGKKEYTAIGVHKGDFRRPDACDLAHDHAAAKAKTLCRKEGCQKISRKLFSPCEKSSLFRITRVELTFSCH